MENVVKKIESTVDRGCAMILAGDFNDWRIRISDHLNKHLQLNEAGLSHLGRHAKTFPTVRPTFALDRIYFRGLNLKYFEVLREGAWQNLSDHLAVSASFG